MKKRILLLLCCFTISNHLSAQYLKNFTLTNRWPVGGCTTVAANDSLGFAGSGGMLTIFRLDDQRRLADWQSPGIVNQIAIYQNYLYIANGFAGLQVINSKQPAKPQVVTSVAGNFQYITGSGNYVIAAPWDGTLRVFNIQNPALPQDVGGYKAQVDDMVATGTLLYIAANTTGLQILDFSNPAAITMIGALTTIKPTRCVLAGNYLYLKEGSKTYIVNVSDPRNPAIAATLTTLNWEQAAASGARLYTADFSKLRTYDIRQPLIPSELEAISQDAPKFLTATSQHLVIAQGDRGLSVFRMDDAGIPNSAYTYEIPGQPSTVHAVSTHYLYVKNGASDNEKVDILDVTDPGRIQKVSEWKVYPEVLAITGDVACYTSGNKFFIVSLADPIAPKETGQLTLDAYNNTVAVWNDMAFVSVIGLTQKKKGVTIIDIRERTKPKSLKFIDSSPYRARVEAKFGNYIYLIDENGLYAMDITDPANPVKKDYLTREDVLWFDIIDHYGWARTDNDTLKIFDLANPNQPKIVHTSVQPIISQPSQQYQGFLYVVSYDGVHIFDVTDPSIVRKTGRISGGVSYVAGSAIQSGHLFASTYTMEQKLYIYNLPEPGMPVKQGILNTWHPVLDIGMDNHGVYVANGVDGLQILDTKITNQSPRVGHWPAFSSMSGVAGNGHFVFAGETEAGVHTLDVSNLNPIRYLGTFQQLKATEVTNRMAASGNYFYWNSLQNGFQIFDITNPAQWQLRSTTPMGKAQGVPLIKGTTAYIPDGTNGLKVINISNADAPQVLGSWSGQVYDIALYDTLAFIAGQYSGLRLLNIKNPAQIREIGKITPYSTVMSLELVGNTLYLAAGYLGVVMFDVTDPFNPVETGRLFFDDCQFTAIAVVGANLAALDPASGVYLLRNNLISSITENSIKPKQFTLAQNYPNPFNSETEISYVLAQKAVVALELFNTRGQRVACLVNGIQESGEYRLHYKADHLPTGLYFYRLKSGDQIQTRKMMLVK